MRRSDFSTGSADAGGEGNSPDPLTTASLLLDAVRRRIYQFVRSARRPVTRNEAAASTHVSRNLAAFHLDKLVEAGLLQASIQKAVGGSRAGRRPKVYEAGPVELHLDIPQRQHGLLAGVLVEALVAGEERRGVTRAAIEAASRRGAELGRAASAETTAGGGDLTRAHAALERLGFEPFEAAPELLRLGNCPFRPLAIEAPDIVCGLNHGLVAGLLTGMGTTGLEAVLAPQPGECCVEIRASAGEDSGS